MKRKRLALAALPLLATWLLGSCAETPSDAYVIENDPGHVEFVDGSEIGTVTLTKPAIARLGIETTPVTPVGRNRAVPDSAVFVDPDGAWWTYTNPRQGVYVRHEVDIKRQRDGLALFSFGPKAGTEVVTVGVAELYGIEAEVGH